MKSRDVVNSGYGTGSAAGFGGVASVDLLWCVANDSRLCVVGGYVRRGGHCGVSLSVRGPGPGPVGAGRLSQSGEWPVPTRSNGRCRDPVIESSIPAVLGERAQRQPNDIAYTFIDYEVDPGGFAESLTWSQVYQRARVVAEELSRCGSVGDRAAILAPQGLDYIVAFFGAMQAGFIAVPLPVPQFGALDERVSAAVRDSSPAALRRSCRCGPAPPASA